MIPLPEHIKSAIWHYIPNLQGWTTPERAEEMAAAILELKHPVAVCIGVFSGRSVIAMGFAMREMRNGMVYGLDPYKTEAATEGNGDEADKEWWANRADLEHMSRYAIEQIWAHRLEQWATLIRASSQHVYQLFPEIGVLEIDGNHSEEASTRDVSLYLPRVIKGGYIFADDVDWPTTAKAISMLDAECELIREVKPEKVSTYRIYRKK